MKDYSKNQMGRILNTDKDPFHYNSYIRSINE